MIKSSRKAVLSFVPVMITLLLTGSTKEMKDSGLDDLKLILMKYLQDFRTEQAYLVTDRYAYRPGEDLWFQGFVSSYPEGKNSVRSDDFFLKLMNSKGEEVVFRRYPLNDCMISGRLLIPRTSIPGRYYLVAYTGWMKNMCPQFVFYKEILVSKYYDKRFQVEVLYDKSAYYAGDSMKAYIRLIDPAGKPIIETGFEYSLGSFNKKELQKGDGITNAKGNAVVNTLIPADEEVQFLNIEIKSRKISGSYSIVIPVVSSGTPCITFYPEGGNLVNGISSLVAFTSRNNLGLSFPIEGKITDQQGKVLCLVKTNNDGTGSFTYTPGDDSCFLKITKPANVRKAYPLPMGKKHGMVIHLNKSNDNCAVFTLLSSNDTIIQETYWLALMNRSVVWDSVVIHQRSSRVILPFQNLKNQGILQLSVFDQHKKLIAERLIRVPARSTSLSMTTNRHTYSNRQRVTMSIEYAGPGNKADLALSVSLLQLSRSAFTPSFISVLNNYYCDTTNYIPINPAQLNDTGLLTSHYRIVDWNEVFDHTGKKAPYKPKDGLTGIVLDKKENLTQHAKVRITHIPNYRSYETQSDEAGIFNIHFGQDIIDFNYLNIDAYDATGKNNMSSAVDQEFSNRLRKMLLSKEKNEDQRKLADLIGYGDPDLIYSLRYGPGKFKKAEQDIRKKYDPNRYAGYKTVLDIIQDIQPYKLVNKMIIFDTPDLSADSIKPQAGSIIVINGSLKGDKVDILSTFSPSDVTNINISTSPADVHRYTPINFHAVIEITTIQGMYKYRQQPLVLGMDILNTSREFYAPDYTVESTTSADNRRTLYWNPHILIKKGQSALISFFTSDTKGIFYGHTEGMDDEGNPVSSEITFIVE
jgi:hypothetical protein